MDLILPENATRELLANNVFDCQIVVDDKRDELQRAESELREAKRALAYWDFRQSVIDSYGPEMLDQVDAHFLFPATVLK